MPIDLSHVPPKCDYCILGKQTWASIPKTREGVKATEILERVHVDLCGPMSPTSRSGNVYSMNIIDDFSSYVWSLPLKSESDAAPVLQQWQQVVENLSHHRLKTLITNNGELISKSMQDWCSARGVDHRTTAPHTSAQNGRRKGSTVLSMAKHAPCALHGMLPFTSGTNLWLRLRS